MVKNDIKCSRCGNLMTQVGSDSKNASYHCSCCGNDVLVAMAQEGNVEYWVKRQNLMSRVRLGVLDWQTTQWDYLAKDIVSFMGTHEQAGKDVTLKMATLACITSGFHNLNKEKYKECAVVFKMTEKAYKSHMKSDENKGDFGSAEDVEMYREYRALYKKCRNDYRNTKVLWKFAFFFVKKLALPF